ncbi:DUF1786 family protein [Methanolobus sp. ZRKC3]|uniref:DUF1786 domain-containing protein n=1 Tax=Methanolobus sp. ZRKC3 TaxID=3125786 RepID=UPI003254F52F
MRILAVDIGTGTQDILLYDTEKEPENSLILVMPSPTVIIAEKVRQATKEGKDIFLKGTVMGGGPSARAIKEHIKQGYKVFSTPKAALTIKDDIEKVRQMGIQIVEENGQEIDTENVEVIQLRDLDIDAISNALGNFGVSMPDMIAVAVQDHGDSPKVSNRIYRFKMFEKLMDAGGDFSVFAYGHDNIPKEFSRISSVSETINDRDAIFMDTGPAAIFGALLDPAAVQPAVVVNIGNGHTLAAIVMDDRIVALFEHHTSSLDGEKLQEYILRLMQGELSFQEVFDEGGHGCYIKNKVHPEDIESVMVTGPRRGILMDMDENCKSELWTRLHFAAPYGNMMLSGCYGLLTRHIYHK